MNTCYAHRYTLCISWYNSWQMHNGEASDGFEFELRPLPTVWCWEDAELPIWESESHKLLELYGIMCTEPYGGTEQGLKNQLSLSHLPSSWHLGPRRPHPMHLTCKPASPGSVSHKGGAGWARDPRAEGLLAPHHCWAQTPSPDSRRRDSEAHCAPLLPVLWDTGGKVPSEGVRSSFCRMGGHSSQAGLAQISFSVFVPHCSSFSSLPTSLCRNSHIHSLNASLFVHLTCANIHFSINTLK